MNETITRLSRILTALTLALMATSLSAQQVQTEETNDDSPFTAQESSKSDSLSIPPELEAIAAPKKPAKKLRTPPDMSKLPTPPPPPNFTPPGMPPSGKPGTKVAQVKTSDKPQDNSTLKITNLVAPGTDLNASVGELVITDMAVNDVLDLLQNFTGKAILRQSTVAGTFNFRSQGAVTRRQAIEAVVSLLALNGVSVSPLGELYLKAVPATSAANSAPVLIEDSTLDYEPSQEVCAKLFKVDFMVMAEAVTALSSMQSGLVGTSVTPFEKNRSILATDSLVNLQRMETMLKRIDKPSIDGAKIIFFPLRNVSAKDALSRCQQLLTGSMASRFTGNTTVDADERTNQLIAYTHPANEAILRDLIDNLDKDVEPLTRTEMFSIHHADVTDLCDVIKEVITGQKQIRSDTSGSAAAKSGSGAQANKQQTAPKTQQAAQAQSVVDNSGTQFSNYITIVPDERTNNLVATGTPSDIRLLGEIVAKLDAVLPQVRIEVIIAEVTLTKGQSSGLDSFGIRYGKTAPTTSLSGDVTSGEGLGGGNKDVWLSPTMNGSGMTVTPLALENFSMDLVFNVAKTNSNVQVLSAPNIVTTHNREASIVVGSKEPVVSSYDTSDDDTDVANISYENIALELTVKPLIGSNGVIQMEITQKVNEVTSRVTLAGYGDQPVIGTRQASSFVTVGDGRMVILGGLQKEKTTKTHNKVYLLGDIPLLGRIFQPKSDEVTRTELIIFIRPVILANPDEANADAEKKIAEVAPSKELKEYMQKGNFREKSKKELEQEKKDKKAAEKAAKKAAKEAEEEAESAKTYSSGIKHGK